MNSNNKGNRVFKKVIYSNLKRQLPLTHYGEYYYIFFYDNATRTYYIKTIQYKNKAFEKFLNQFEKMLKRYQFNRGEEFNNKAFKSLCLKHGVQ